MTVFRKMVTAALPAILLAGCAGVPDLGLARRAPGNVYNYKVTDIVDHLSCELHAAMKDHQELADNSYRISVLLTLKVDDNLDLTPSLTLMNPMQNEKYSFSGLIAADLGGARQRTFTTNYTLEAERLKDAPWCDVGKDVTKKAMYRLDGNLGLSEIIREGLKVTEEPKEDRGVHLPTSPDDKAAPSFGSYVQFAVTRQLGGLGPLWTVRRLKGPSGGSGLLNGKRLTTDSLAIAFAAPAPPRQDRQAAAMEQLTRALGDLGKQIAENSAALAKRDQARVFAAQVEQRLSATLNLPVRNDRGALVKRNTARARLQAAQGEAQAAEDALARQQSARATAELKADAARVSVDLANAEAARTRPSTDAAGTARDLLGTILLQNLAGSNQPR